MDPITLSILFGSAALAGAGITRAMNEPEPGDMVIRKVFNTSDGWMTTELLSPYTLDLTGQILDMNLNGLWPKIESGFFRVMVLALPGGDLKKQVLLVLQSAGQYGWFLSEAYCPGYRRVQGRLAYQRIEALLGFLNTDPADVVVNHAMSLTDLNARYDYLKFAISANPQLAALLSMSDDFKTITRETVKVVDPATYNRVESQRAGQVRRQLGVQPYSVTDHSLDYPSFTRGRSPSPEEEEAFHARARAEQEVSDQVRIDKAMNMPYQSHSTIRQGWDGPTRPYTWSPRAEYTEKLGVSHPHIADRIRELSAEQGEPLPEQQQSSGIIPEEAMEATREAVQQRAQNAIQHVLNLPRNAQVPFLQSMARSDAAAMALIARDERMTEIIRGLKGGDQDMTRVRLLTAQVLRTVNQIPEPRAQLQYLEQISEKYPGATRASPEIRARLSDLEAMVHPERALIPEKNPITGPWADPEGLYRAMKKAGVTAPPPQRRGPDNVVNPSMGYPRSVRGRSLTPEEEKAFYERGAIQQRAQNAIQHVLNLPRSAQIPFLQSMARDDAAAMALMARDERMTEILKSLKGSNQDGTRRR